MKKKYLFILVLPALVLSLALAAYADSIPPKKKQTALGLYVTAKDAYVKWHVNPDKVQIIDVRTPEEYIFVGHAPMAVNIPVKFVKHVWNANRKALVMTLNPDFIAEINKRFKITDTLYVMCRSGGRSAFAVNLLAKAGFKNVYNIIDGFEGDKVKNPDSYFKGKRNVNGWKNAGAPWTYQLDPELLYLP
ncbi:MAG: sulfurtransferase [Deltaproteobacteria bacterium]|nr:sulfurtransferase [Deltaproteobacteria bacterium]